MVIQHVLYFLAAADERNITRAARICGVKQPTLSLAIRQLETNLGVKLFERSARGIVLTPAGKAIRPHFTSALRALERARQAAGKVGSRTSDLAFIARPDRPPV